MRPRELTEDLKALPDDVRQMARGTEDKLQDATKDKPTLAWALDFRVVLTAAAVAILVSLVLRLAGLGFLLTLLVFFLLFGGLWYGISRFAAPRAHNAPDGADEPDDPGEQRESEQPRQAS
jgi:hypothetical protein